MGAKKIALAETALIEVLLILKRAGLRMRSQGGANCFDIFPLLNKTYSRSGH